ncbi:MAG: hypothetical protein IPG58_02615 [Acidobacteria bacterium]|nr:hypothetical protein [Acidobacteriota bacterium]
MKLGNFPVVFFTVIFVAIASVAQTGFKSPQQHIAAIEAGEREIAADPWNQRAYTNHRLALYDLEKERRAGRTGLPAIQPFLDRVSKGHPNNICVDWSIKSLRPWKNLKEYADAVELSLRSHTDRRGDTCAADLAKDAGIMLSKDGQYKRAEEFFVKQKAVAPKDPFVDGYIREAKEKAHTKMMQDVVKIGAAEGSKEPKLVILPDGGIYVGQVNAADRPHGKGRYQGQNGNIYEGSFFDGQMTGYGVTQIYERPEV